MPDPVFAARRTTMLVFHDRGGDEGDEGDKAYVITKGELEILTVDG